MQQRIFGWGIALLGAAVLAGAFYLRELSAPVLALGGGFVFFGGWVLDRADTSGFLAAVKELLPFVRGKGGAE